MVIFTLGLKMNFSDKIVAWARAVRSHFLGFFCSLGVSLSAADVEVTFNRDIRPILSSHCYECHGPDAKQRKGGSGGLRLDTRHGALEDLGEASAIVPGDPDASLVIQRILSSDPDDKMPPPESGKEVSQDALVTLKKWIQQGAPYEDHWSYVRPVRPNTPAVEAVDSTVFNAIDQFVLQRVGKQGLRQSKMADRYTLARRAALDLTGLPPTPQEADLFAADSNVNAYETFIDALLEKDAFGEHWGRYWLDQARYADSAGYADDPPRTIWGFRDYVIRAMNDNIPFDQFTVEQIAGDLLPDPTEDQLVATAFHRNTMTNNEGGTNDEEFRNVAVVDRVTTTMAVWMGTTMTCAQCHDHKYDPISQEDFYRFFALFNQTADADRRDESPLLSLYTKEQKQKRSQLETERLHLDKMLKTPSASLLVARRLWEKRLLKSPAWTALSPVSSTSSEGTSLKLGSDHVVVAQGGSVSDTYTLDFEISEGRPLTGLRLEALPHLKLTGQGPGFDAGNFLLTSVQSELTPPPGKTSTGQFVRLRVECKQKILSLAEVQVFQGEVNLALEGKASQSSTAFDGPAHVAVDGNTDGDYHAAKSTTHTETEDNPWWELDLGKHSAIDRITIWNRTDGNVQSRLDGLSIDLLNAERKVIWSHTIEKAPKESDSFIPDGARPVSFDAAHADFSQSGHPASDLIKYAPGKTKGWAVAPRTGQAHNLHLLLSTPVYLEAGSRLSVMLGFGDGSENTNLGRFRLSMTSDEQATDLARTPPAITKLSKIPELQRSKADEQHLIDHYLSIAPDLDDERARLLVVDAELAAIKPRTTVPVMRRIAIDEHRETHIQRRGNYLDLGATVSPGIPGVFAQSLKDPPSDRLAMARWLVSRENPLTGRVIVNRMWESLFGVGLVRTSEEFGSQGDPPSHPGLLDWLAVEFIDSGWNFKHMLRLMVTSATYRQSSRVTPSTWESDPENRWFARGPRVRLSAETIRDQALFVSGLLSEKKYGPSVNPPQPKMGLNAAFGGGIDWKTSEGEDRYRKGLYTTWRRSNPYPSMATFDAPNREVCILKRDRSNTPLQALVTLNDPAFIEAAQSLARRMSAAASHPVGKLEHGFRHCLTRTPSEPEIRQLLKLYTQSYETYVERVEDARRLVEKPVGAMTDGADPRELAAWTVVANVLLNLDETLMKR